MVAFCAAALALPMAALMYVGTFSRPTVDDFCWPPPLLQHGFWALQWESFQTSFGRWASTALISVVSYAGGSLTPLLPACFLLLWLAGSAALAARFVRSDASSRLAIAVVFAELVLLVTLAAAPDARQPVFWQTGLLTYLPPLALAPVCAALVSRGARPLLVALLACVCAGFNEPAMTIVFVTAAGAVVVLHGRPRRAAIGAVAGAAVSAAIMLASPGNAIRRGTFDPGWGVLARLEGRWTAELLLALLRSPTAWLALVVAAAVAATTASDRPPAPSVSRLGGVGVLLVAAGVAPAVWAFGDVPGRAAFPAMAAGAWCWVSIGVRLGWRLRTRDAWGARAVAGTAATVLAVLALVSAGRLMTPFEAYAEQWSVQDSVLRAAQRSGGVAVLPGIARNPYGLEDVGQPHSVWATECALEYYRLKAIRVQGGQK